MDPDTEVEFEFTPFLRCYKSGRLERILESEFLPPSLDPATGVSSKDVIIDPATGVSARLYLPTNSTTTTGDDDEKKKKKKKLPILVYFHGGAFCIETPYSPMFHPYLNALASLSGAVAVSVDYRRAPEHRLPAAYDDSWAALRWVATQATGGAGCEPWLAEHADSQRVFLAGDSAGANIAHNVAMRAAAEGAGGGFPLRIKGLALVHPYFWGKEAVGAESTAPEFRERMERMWRLLCPESTEGADDRRLNPRVVVEQLAELPAERVLVEVAEKDVLRERGVAYGEWVKGSGWGGEVEVVESLGEGHVFHLLDQRGEKARALMDRLVASIGRV